LAKEEEYDDLENEEDYYENQRAFSAEFHHPS